MSGGQNNDLTDVPPKVFSPSSESTENLALAEKLKLRVKLWKCEKVIRRGRDTWLEIASALMEIRDLRLYRGEGFTDFGSYCKERLQMGKSTINRQIGVGEVYHALASTGATVLPTSERQIRPLLSLKQSKQEPAVWRENVAKVWIKAVNDSKITKKPLTEKSVLLSQRQLGLHPGAQKSQTEFDPQVRWKRMESLLWHEREFWPADQLNNLCQRITVLIRGWENGMTNPVACGVHQPVAAGDLNREN